MIFKKKALTQEQAVAELQAIIDGAEPIVRKQLQPGQYTDPVVINSVFVKLLSYFEKKFHKYARRVPEELLVSNFMGNYEQAFGNMRRTGQQPQTLPDNFGSPPSVQTALLFGIESALLHSKPWWLQWVVHMWRLLKEKLGLLDEFRLAIDFKAAELCVTEMVEEAESSNQVYGIYKDHTTLTVRPPRQAGEPREKFMTSRIDEQLKQEMEELVGDPRAENAKKRELFNGRDVPSELETRRAAFDEAFRNELGADFEQIRTILLSFTHERPFILREKDVVKQISRQFDFEPRLVRRIIDGLLLTKRKLQASETPIWKIDRQNNRISRRPIVGLRLWDGHFYLGWSPVILDQMLNHFNELMIYRELPQEWMKGEVKTELERLSGEVSDWFENEVIRLLSERGFTGRSVNRGIGRGQSQISNPKGQIDFLGFNNELGVLLVAECKLVKWSGNAAAENGDYKDFIRNDEKPKKKTYADKLKMKYEWVCENASDVMHALASEYPNITYGEQIRIAHVMITYHPTRIAVFSKDFPLRSVVRFIEDFDAAQDWPYDFGQQPVTLQQQS